jgi:hypothetical protein
MVSGFTLLPPQPPPPFLPTGAQLHVVISNYHVVISNYHVVIAMWMQREIFSTFSEKVRYLPRKSPLLCEFFSCSPNFVKKYQIGITRISQGHFFSFFSLVLPSRGLIQAINCFPPGIKRICFFFFFFFFNKKNEWLYYALPTASGPRALPNRKRPWKKPWKGPQAKALRKA